MYRILIAFFVVATVGIYSLCSRASWAGLQSDAKGGCRVVFANQVPGAAVKGLVLRKAQHEGFFKVASRGRQLDLSEKYLRSLEPGNSIENNVGGRVHRVFERDLNVDFNTMKRSEIAGLENFGLRMLGSNRKVTNPVAREQLEKISKFGYKSFGRMLYFTSAAGLWSRGGGMVKALIPINIEECLKPRVFEKLVRAGDISTAKSPTKRLEIAGRELRPGESLKRISAKICRASKKTIKSILKVASEHPDALNVLDMKFANIALLSKKARAYIHFDIWTSEQTHEALRKYISNLKVNYEKKIFHPDSKIDREIKEALRNYFRADKSLEETHLFGYQKGVYGIDPETGEPLTETVPIGEGAGMAKQYLDETGRSGQLKRRGVRDWVFENVEVASGLIASYGAHVKGKEPVSVIIVPTQEGYTGGSPYKIVAPDGVNYYKLLEGSAVSDRLKNNNSYFNANTIFQSLDLRPPNNTGFERKVQDNLIIVRVKLNAGNVTLDNKTSLIGGRVLHEYENFKNYREYRKNGVSIIKMVQDFWESLIRTKNRKTYLFPEPAVEVDVLAAA